jgi:hypothetical protein
MVSCVGAMFWNEMYGENIWYMKKNGKCQRDPETATFGHCYAFLSELVKMTLKRLFHACD